ncbi:MAG TPA: enoyl-CoA hydratase-related protein, partial [Chryseolinea sp.]|nr:enoyl-CoA hydratase-related protein [Chryseolinea sp.]
MEFIKVNAQHEAGIALIQLNRPKELNALNRQLMEEVRDALKQLDKDETVRVIIITGNEQAFAAGADIKQMANQSASICLLLVRFGPGNQFGKQKK